MEFISYFEPDNIPTSMFYMKENGKYKVDAYEGKNESDEAQAPLAEGMDEAAKAATETVKIAASDTAEAVKTAMGDTDGDDGSEHDEL